MSWQRANVQAAANYLRERIAAGAPGSEDVRSKAIYEGLLDVLDPARRTARVQRESAAVRQVRRHRPGGPRAAQSGQPGSASGQHSARRAAWNAAPDATAGATADAAPQSVRTTR